MRKLLGAVVSISLAVTAPVACNAILGSAPAGNLAASDGNESGASSGSSSGTSTGSSNGSSGSSSGAGNPDGGGDAAAGTGTCTSSGQCSTAGGCVDGYCCDTTCADSCHACNVPGFTGTCSLVPAGQTPATGHPSCGPDAVSTCMRDGTCDGSGACRLYVGGTDCGAAGCVSATNVFTAASTCNGTGTCQAGSTLSCAPYTCQSATACYAACTGTNTGCSGTNVCTTGSCGPKGNGADCDAGAQCGSTFCTDGVCCKTACGTTCSTCDQNSALGVCTPVPPGTDPKDNCPAGTGANAHCSPGECNGSGACNLASVGTVCQAQQCASDKQTNAGTCNAGGTCTIPTSVSCAPYICGTNACNNPCSVQTDCNAGYYCAAGTCASCVPANASNPVFVDPTNGTDDANHGAEPGTCGYKTLTYALAHATGTINLLNSASYAGPFTLSGSQAVQGDPNNTGNRSALYDGITMNGSSRLLNCDVSDSNDVEFSACITLGTTTAVTVTNCNIHACSSSQGTGVAGNSQNGATFQSDIFINVSNCFNQMGNVTINSTTCNCDNDWINGCGTLSGTSNCCSAAGGACGGCNSCTCPSNFFNSPVTTCP